MVRRRAFSRGFGFDLGVERGVVDRGAAAAFGRRGRVIRRRRVFGGALLACTVGGLGGGVVCTTAVGFHRLALFFGETLEKGAVFSLLLGFAFFTNLAALA